MKKHLFLLALIVLSWCQINAQTILGIDVSGTGQGVINWPQVYASGKVFAWAKATEGFTFNDTRFTANMTNGSAAGVVMGAYHFARPDNNSAINEANHFLSIAQSYIGPGKLPPALDIEDPSSTIILQNLFTSAALTTWVQTWLTTVQNATGITPVIYTSSNYAAYLGSSLNGYKLWIAKPDGNATTPPTGLGNWSTWAVKQYSWTGSVSGITGAVDLDVFNGTIAQFNSFIGLGTASIQSFSISPGSVTTCNSCFSINYNISASNSMTVMLGASIKPTGSATWIDDTPHDIKLTVPASASTQTRTFCLPAGTAAGSYDVLIAIWLDNNNNNIIDAGDTQLNSTSQNSLLTVTTGTTTTPSASGASGITGTAFTASWTATSDATGYSLDVSTSSSFASFVSGYNNLAVNNVTSYVVSGLNCNTAYYYRVRATSGCGASSNSNTIPVTTSTANPEAPVVTPTRPIPICTGGSATLTISNPCAGCTYFWSDGGNGVTHVVSVNGGYYAWVQNSCGTSANSNTVNINVSGAPAQPGTITGNTVVTVGQSLPYSIAAVNGATSYNWSVNGGGTVTGNNTSSNVTWNVAGNYVLSVTAGNNCGNSPAKTLNVTVNNVTAIGGVNSERYVTVLPNPAKDEIIIRAKGVGSGKTVRIEIFAIDGRVVYSSGFRNDTGGWDKRIDISRYAVGIYSVRVVDGNKIDVLKFSKIN